MPKLTFLLAALCSLLLLCTGVASAKTHRLKPVSQSAGMLTFNVSRIGGKELRKARITHGRRSRAVSLRRLRSAIRGRGLVRVWRVSRTRRGRRAPDRLVIITVKRRAMQDAKRGPAAGPGAPAEPGAPAHPEVGDALLSDDFSTANGPNDLITNEYAFWNRDPLGVRSPNWEITSGSLFSKNGIGWSGQPDAITPVGASLNGSGSYVFRMRTKATHTGSARQEVRARINGFGSGTSTRPPTAWDGVVLWPRYVSERNLYFAYILRRDGRVAITKKCDGKLPGGGYYNNGTYFGLTSERHYADTIPGRWYRLATEAVDNPDGSVTIRLYRDGQLAAEATDTGTGCAPIRGTARLGIRADNTDFNITNYRSNRIP